MAIKKKIAVYCAALMVIILEFNYKCTLWQIKRIDKFAEKSIFHFYGHFQALLLHEPFVIFSILRR